MAPLVVTVITGQSPGEDIIHAFIHSTQIIKFLHVYLYIQELNISLSVDTATDKTHLQRSPGVLRETEAVKHHVLPKT